MGSTQELTILKVVRHQERNVFTLLSQVFPEVLAGIIDEGTKVQVMRDGSLFDEGEVKILEEEMSGRGWDSFFLGFNKVLPDEKRPFSNIKERTSIMPSLNAEWFQDGDQVHLGMNSLKFRISYRVITTPVRLIGHSKKKKRS